jgi:hypothetical protein
VDLVAAAVGNVAQLLDVDVDEFTGRGAFVAADRPVARWPLVAGADVAIHAEPSFQDHPTACRTVRNLAGQYT